MTFEPSSNWLYSNTILGCKKAKGLNSNTTLGCKRMKLGPGLGARILNGFVVYNGSIYLTNYIHIHLIHLLVVELMRGGFALTKATC